MVCQSSASYTQTETSGTQSLKSNDKNKVCGYCDTGSVLIGKTFCKLEVNMYSNDNTIGGSITVGVWNSSGTLVHTFGSMSVSGLSNSPTFYAFSSATNYTMQEGDRFGAYSDATTAGGKIIVTSDDVDPLFDSTNTSYSVWSTQSSSWSNNSALDLAFKLYEDDGSGGSGGSGGGGEDPPSTPDNTDGSTPIEHILYLNTRVPR